MSKVKNMLGRIFVTGDTHGLNDFEKFNPTNFPQQNDLTKKDYVIVSGDYGGIFYGKKKLKKLLEEHPEMLSMNLNLLDKDEYALQQYSNKNFTTLFIDGNHENFNELNSYPIEIWNGGKVHKIKDDIIHLMRGQVYTIYGKKFFTMGGADSIDRYLRVENVSWWKEEMPSLEECDEALSNLDKNNWEVDYVISHAAPDNILYRINPTFSHTLITNFLFTVEKDLAFKHWYFGHYHIDKEMDDKHTCLYNIIKEI